MLGGSPAVIAMDTTRQCSAERTQTSAGARPQAVPSSVRGGPTAVGICKLMVRRPSPLLTLLIWSPTWLLNYWLQWLHALLIKNAKMKKEKNHPEMLYYSRDLYIYICTATTGQTQVKKLGERWGSYYLQQLLIGYNWQKVHKLAVIYYSNHSQKSHHF